MTLEEVLRTLEWDDVKHVGSVGPGVHAFGAKRPMNRIRAHSSAGLGPFAGRGTPSEVQLFGHVHVDGKGAITRVEGFNGAEGERWAKRAHAHLEETGALGPNAELVAFTPLRACPYTGVR